VKTLPDVLTVTPPKLGNDGRTAVVSVIPRSGPHDNATTDLVKTIRAEAPAMAATDGGAVSVTGPTAVGIDISNRLSSSLVPFAALVVGLSLVLLLIKFRSIVVPIKPRSASSSRSEPRSAPSSPSSSGAGPTPSSEPPRPGR